MVETAIVAVFVFVIFALIFQFADNFRAKLLLEYAAGRCARAATIGLNSFMVRKTANVATAAAAGKCLTTDSNGNRLSSSAIVGRFPGYLSSTYHAQAEHALDFEFWPRNSVSTSLSGARLTATVSQRRPQFFSFSGFSPSDDLPPVPNEANISASANIEAHFPDWMQ